MLTMAKIFWELFTPTLKGIAVSRLVAGLGDHLRRMQIDKAIRNKESDVFSAAEHKH